VSTTFNDDDIALQERIIGMLEVDIARKQELLHRERHMLNTMRRRREGDKN